MEGASQFDPGPAEPLVMVIITITDYGAVEDVDESK